jgi:NADPH:quinone reductase-like Zn-dependent oxidoreductase
MVEIEAPPLRMNAAGQKHTSRLIYFSRLPFRLGYDVSGTVVAVGSAVSPELQPGTEVFSKVPEKFRGTAAEYAISTDNATAKKPQSLSHIEAASIPLVALTALQALDIADKYLEGGLRGKTVYIPAALSGVGSVAVQLAKKVFHVGRVVTTLSTGKIGKADNLLGDGVLDQIVDYTKEDPVKTLSKNSIDFMFDLIDGQAMKYLSIMKPGGLIVSITGIPFGPDLEREAPHIPVIARLLLNTIGWFIQFRAGRYQVKYVPIFTNSKATDLDRLRGWIDEGSIRPIIGQVEQFNNLEKIREICQGIFSGKGGIGKFVINVLS